MSDGLHSVAGVPGELTIGGKTYRCEPDRLRIRAEIEAHVIAEREKSIPGYVAAAEMAGEPHKKAAWQAVMDRIDDHRRVTDDNVRDFLRTREGTVFFFWLCVRPHHPEVDTLEKAAEICRALSLDLLDAQLHAATGRTDLKKSAGPDQTEGRAEGETECPGPTSTKS